MDGTYTVLTLLFPRPSEEHQLVAHPHPVVDLELNFLSLLERQAVTPCVPWGGEEGEQVGREEREGERREKGREEREGERVERGREGRCREQGKRKKKRREREREG